MQEDNGLFYLILMVVVCVLVLGILLGKYAIPNYDAKVDTSHNAVITGCEQEDSCTADYRDGKWIIYRSND